MAHRTRILMFMIALIVVHCAANGAVPDNIKQNDVPPSVTPQNAPAPVTTSAPQDAHYEHPNTDMPFISINTATPLDLNWTAALEFGDPALRPTPVTLPFLPDYPFDNLEIKLRVLNLKF